MIRDVVYEDLVQWCGRNSLDIVQVNPGRFGVTPRQTIIAQVSGRTQATVNLTEEDVILYRPRGRRVGSIAYCDPGFPEALHAWLWRETNQREEEG